MEFNEFWLDLFTEPGDLVVDFFAGIASMGLACVKLNRMYFGTESTTTTYDAALYRLMKFCAVRQRGDVTEPLQETKGMPKSILEQVLFPFFFQFFICTICLLTCLVLIFLVN